jgi:hypothetical protein
LACARDLLPAIGAFDSGCLASSTFADIAEPSGLIQRYALECRAYGVLHVASDVFADRRSPTAKCRGDSSVVLAPDVNG